MKTTITTLLLVWGATAITAQPKPKISLEKVAEPATPGVVQPESPPDPLPDRYEIFASYARGNKLVGYNDPRYVASDKTDYLKSDAMTANLEFTARVPYRIRGGKNSALTDFFDGIDFLRFGGQITGWSILTGPGVSIPKTGTPINADAVSANINAATRPGLGFYFGVGKQNFEIDLGLVVSLSVENEGSRTRYVTNAAGIVQTDASGNYLTEQVAGRGQFWTNPLVLPTLKFVWGQRNNLQFFVMAGREQFEFQRDYLQSYFRIPVVSFFKLDFGIGLFPAASVFVQPNIEIGRIMIGLRGAYTLNYYAPELRRVGGIDSIYFGVSLSGRF